jgi:hypothetical protein
MMVSQLYTPFVIPQKPISAQPNSLLEEESSSELEPIATLEERQSSPSAMAMYKPLSGQSASFSTLPSASLLERTASAPAPSASDEELLIKRLQTVEHYEQGILAPAVLHDIAQTTQLLAPSQETKQQIWVYLKSIEQLSLTQPVSKQAQQSIETLLKQVASQLDAHVQTSLGKGEQQVVQEWLDALLQQPIRWQSPADAFVESTWESALDLKTSPLLSERTNTLNDAPAKEESILPPLTQQLSPLWQQYKASMQQHAYGEAYTHSAEALGVLKERLTEPDALKLQFQWERLAAKAALGKQQAGVALGHLESALDVVTQQGEAVTTTPLASQQQLWQEKARLLAVPLKRPARSALAWLQVARLSAQQGETTQQYDALAQAAQQFEVAQQPHESYKVWQSALRLSKAVKPEAIAQSYDALLRLGEQAPTKSEVASVTPEAQRRLFKEALLYSKQSANLPLYTDLLQRYGIFNLQQGQTDTAQRVLTLLQQLGSVAS